MHFLHRGSWLFKTLCSSFAVHSFFCCENGMYQCQHSWLITNLVLEFNFPNQLWSLQHAVCCLLLLLLLLSRISFQFYLKTLDSYISWLFREVFHRHVTWFKDQLWKLLSSFHWGYQEFYGQPFACLVFSNL